MYTNVYEHMDWITPIISDLVSINLRWQCSVHKKVCLINLKLYIYIYIHITYIHTFRVRKHLYLPLFYQIKGTAVYWLRDTRDNDTALLLVEVLVT